jgi:hypothetical protein
VSPLANRLDTGRKPVALAGEALLDESGIHIVQLDD